MTPEDLLTISVGENIDALVNIDLAGYGVPRAIYAAARRKSRGPLLLTAAQEIQSRVKPNDAVVIGTGFVFPPWNTGELDGLVGASVIARSLDIGLAAKPVIVCEEELVAAASAVARTAGLQPRDNVDRWRKEPHTVLVRSFTKDQRAAPAAAKALLDELAPKVVLSIERPGRSTSAVYHMGNGVDVTTLAAKFDECFVEMRARGGLTVAIGDRGNELGMGAIRDAVRAEIPFGRDCGCPCGAGIAAEVVSDVTITAAVSDWGAYGLAAAIAFVTQKRNALHGPSVEQRILRSAVEAGMIDGSGYAIPAVDGVGEDYNAWLVQILGEVVEYPLRMKARYAAMYERMLRLRAEGRA
jgi:hypothetical protein